MIFTMRAGLRSTWFWLAVVCTATPALPLARAVAQQGPPAPDRAPNEPPRPVRVDTVIATVNDAAIMLSRVRSAVDARAKGLGIELGRPLQQAEIMTLYRAFLDREIERHSLAQSAKSFGFATPEQVEQLFADEMKREEAAQVRDFGTWQNFSRELERTGRTWQTFMREERVRTMSELAREFAVTVRLQKQRNLFLTPRMMRETYQRNVAHFVHDAEAEVHVIQFRGADAEAHARQAKAVWTDPTLIPPQVIDSITGASATALRPMVVTRGSESLPPELVEFALAGPEGNISEPLHHADGIWLAKVNAYRPARNGVFEDPEVQIELRNLCMQSVENEFLKQALERAANRTEVWKTPELR